MTKQEAIKILAVLKAAYPNSYKGLTKDEANGIIGVWATQFVNIPYALVSMAINKLISTNTFPPTINEVKEKIRSLYSEAVWLRTLHRQALEIRHEQGFEDAFADQILDERTLAQVNEIIRLTSPMRDKQLLEPSLGELLKGFNQYLESGNDTQTPLLGGGNNDGDI